MSGLTPLASPFERTQFLPTMMSYRGVWASGTQYFKNDVVTSSVNGAVYILNITSLNDALDPANDPLPSPWSALSGSGVSGGIPLGGIVDYAGATAPSGYAVCDGSAISRTTYSQLFTLIGTTYGAGDGSTTFNIPNFGSGAVAGRVARGVGVGYALAASGGADTVTLTTDNIPAHTHAQTGLGLLTNPGGTPSISGPAAPGQNYPNVAGTTGNPATGVNTTAGTAVALANPYLVVNKIIRIVA